MADRLPPSPRRRPLPAWPALLLCLAALALPAGGAARAAPTAPEQARIEREALAAFQHVMQLWREELYFELYDLGMETTQARISREDFAQRMVRLSWVPEGELNPKFLSTDFRFRTLVYVRARIKYRNKFKPEENFTKDRTVLLLRENDVWRVDLVELVRSPFS